MAEATYTGDFVAQGELNVSDILSQAITTNPNAPFVRDFFNSIAEPLIKTFRDAKIDSIKVDLGSLLGLTPEYTARAEKEFQRTTQKLLSIVRKQVDKLEDVDLTKDFNLTSLLGAPPRARFTTWTMYQDTMAVFLRDLKKALGKVDLGKMLQSQSFSLSSLFGSTPQLDIFNRNNYQDIMSKVLKQLKKAAGSLEITNEFNWSDLFGTTPQMDIFNRYYYYKLIDKVLFTLRKQVDTLDVKKEIDIADLLGTPEFSFFTRRKYQQTIRGLLGKLDKLDISQVMRGGLITKVIPPKEDKDDKQGLFKELLAEVDKTLKPKTDLSQVQELQEEQPVKVMSFSDAALDKLREVFKLDKKQMATVTAAPEPPKEMLPLNKSMFGILGAVLGGLLGATGLGIGIAGLMNAGPFKGTEKLLSRGFLKLSEFFLKRSWAFLKRLAKLPGVLLKKFLPASLMDVLKGSSKLAEEGVAKEGLKIGESIGIKGGAKLLGKGFLKSLGKKIPFLGVILGIAFAISRFKQGDWIGGLLEIASGIAGGAAFWIGGLGTGISVALDVLLASRDVAEGGPEGIKKSGGMGKWDKKVWDWLSSHYPIKGFMEFGEGIKKVASGDIVGGLKLMGKGMYDSSLFAPILDLLGIDATKGSLPESAKTAITKTADFLSSIANSISKFFSGIVDDATSFLKKHLPPKVLSWIGLDKTPDKPFTPPSPTISNVSPQENMLPQAIDTYRIEAPDIGEMVQQIAGSTDNDNSDVVDGLDDVTKKLDTMVKVNMQLVNEYKGAGKSLNVIAKNTQDMQTGNTYQSVSNQPQSGGGRPFSGSRDPAYEHRKAVWAKTARA